MPCSENVGRDWQVLRCSPGRFDSPVDLRDEWSASTTVENTTTVATIFGVDEHPDDFDWWFRTTVEPRETSVIEFRGLTFPATVYVDGVAVDECRSMFLPLRVECPAGSHEVCVRFKSLTAWLTIRRPRGRWRSSLVGAPGMRWARTTLIGRAPVYGTVPAPVGFWRPVVMNPARHLISCTVSTDPSSGEVSIVGSSGANDGTAILATIADGSGATVAEMHGRVHGGLFTMQGRVAAPELWWPHGYGRASIYELSVDIDAHTVHRRPIGFRRVNAVTQDGGFEIQVNGITIFCRGATWSPPDPVGLVVDRPTMRALIKTFVDAGANMLRIVGGLVYEQDEFWEICAELGVMVWQDAMLSTFDPPSEQSDLIADELSGVLDAVSGNPSLTVVSGGSETIQRPEMLGLNRAARTIPVVESILPDRVARHSDVPYVTATPSPPPDSDDLAVRPDSGIAHWFGVGGYLRPVADVRVASVRFAAECLAFANPPVPAAVERHFGSAAVAGHHPLWKAGVPRDRGASWDFEDVRDYYAERLFGEDMLATRRIDPERYLELGRLAVAEAMRECFAYWRRADSGCSGSLVLAGKDMCAGAGWGLLDVDGTPKPALAVLSRVWAPVAVIIGDEGLAGVRIDVHNDTDRSVSGPLRLIATQAGGIPVIDVTENIVVPPHSSVTTTDAHLTGTFRDLNHAFRFGPASADAIEVLFDYDGAPAPARDTLVVCPRGGQPASGVEVTAMLDGDDRWAIAISSEFSLRYVTLDIPGWQPADDYFHVPAAATRQLLLRRTTARRTTAHRSPCGTLDSIDLSSPKSFGAQR